ncbi:hypothetical protein D9M69_501100 [compost metagenome]
MGLQVGQALAHLFTSLPRFSREGDQIHLVIEVDPADEAARDRRLGIFNGEPIHQVVRYDGDLKSLLYEARGHVQCDWCLTDPTF